jgi:hypothetical protein
MADSARDDYIRSIDPRHVPTVLELDRAVTDAHREFDVGIYYRQLTYAIGGDFRRWVCAIGTTKKGATLHFLYGRLMDDPRKVFRGAPTSPLRTIDFASVEAVDPELVKGYVGEAVSTFDEFKALPPNWYKEPPATT